VTRAIIASSTPTAPADVDRPSHQLVARGDDARALLGAVLDDLDLGAERRLEVRQPRGQPPAHARGALLAVRLLELLIRGAIDLDEHAVDGGRLVAQRDREHGLHEPARAGRLRRQRIVEQDGVRPDTDAHRALVVGERQHVVGPARGHGGALALLHDDRQSPSRPVPSRHRDPPSTILAP
jgi:hypothetical protein